MADILWLLILAVIFFPTLYFVNKIAVRAAISEVLHAKKDSEEE